MRPAFAALAAILVFLPSLRHGFVPWDDDLYLLSQDGWRGLGPAQWAWAFRATVGGVWQPLAWLSYGFDHALWGMNPVGYHLTAILLHSVAAALVVVIAAEILGKERRFAALISGLFFALHPLRVESVSWAAERRDVLSAVFVLAAIYSYLRGRARLVFVFHLLALLAKAQAAMLPILLLTLDFWPLRRLSIQRFREKVPLFFLSFAAVLVAGSIQVRMRWSLSDHGLMGRLFQCLHGVSFYAAKTLLPLGLTPLYELRPPFVLTAYSVLGVVGIILVAVKAVRRPWLATAGAWYLICLAPMLGLFQFGPQIVADRYSYLACLPLALSAAAFLEAPKRRLAAGLFVVALAFACLTQQRVWADGESLWGRVLETDPASATARVALGVARGGDEALFEEALALSDCAAAWGEKDSEARRRSLEPKPQCRKARFNRGVSRAVRGDRTGARADFEALRDFDPSDPVVAAALARLGVQPR